MSSFLETTGLKTPKIDYSSDSLSREQSYCSTFKITDSCVEGAKFFVWFGLPRIKKMNY